MFKSDDVHPSKMMTHSDIVHSIHDPFQQLQSTHKRLARTETVWQEHYKDCTFKPAGLKTSQTIAEKRYREDLEKSRAELGKLQESRTKTAMLKQAKSSKNLKDKSPVRVSLLYLDGKKKMQRQQQMVKDQIQS